MLLISARKNGRSSHELASSAQAFRLLPTDDPDRQPSADWARSPARENSFLESVREWTETTSASSWHSTETVGEMDAMSDTEAVEHVAGQTVLVLVHGFNTPFSSVCRAYEDIRARFQTYAPEAYDRIVGFTWPGGDASYHYFSAKERLQPAARALRRWIRMLRRRGAVVDVLAHSLGGRLVRQTLQHGDHNGDRPEESRPDEAHVRNLFAVAPAVRLSNVGADAEARAAFDRGFLFYTRDDRVLGRWFRLFEGESAVGYAGPEELPAVSPPAPVTAVNCDGIIDSHVAYLEREAFYRYVADALNTPPSSARSTPSVRWDVLRPAYEA